jgi:hypothetical protein
MLQEDSSEWMDYRMGPLEEQQISTYLRSRLIGGNDWINFQPNMEQDGDAIARQLALDMSKPVIGLLTNVIWDAQLHFDNSAFPSMLEWLFASIEYFLARSDLQLVIRVHPAEVLGSVPSMQHAVDEIVKRFGTLPSHIKLIGPNDKISTYALMSLCNSVLVYGTKTALELACSGLPVVVAGSAWCRGKGFTIDVSSSEEYLSVLESLPIDRRLSEEQVRTARKYAYHFFFRRMIPIKSLKPAKVFGPYAVRVSSLEELMPGSDPGLDVICEGVLCNSSFVFD